jgi:hypothetical protein
MTAQTGKCIDVLPEPRFDLWCTIKWHIRWPLTLRSRRHFVEEAEALRAAADGDKTAPM